MQEDPRRDYALRKLQKCLDYLITSDDSDGRNDTPDRAFARARGAEWAVMAEALRPNSPCRETGGQNKQPWPQP